VGNGNEDFAQTALSHDGHSVIVVDSYGTVYLQNFDSGTIERRIVGPRDLVRIGATLLGPGTAAIDPADDTVAIVDNGKVLVTEINTGKVITRPPGINASYVVYAGDHLLVQRVDGSLEVWNARGTEQQRVIPGDLSYVEPPVASGRGDLVARQRSDGSTDLDDVASGTSLASLPAPLSAALELKMGLGFSPSGGELLTLLQTVAGTQPLVIERNISAQALVSSACAAAGGNLTASEWRMYVGTTPPGNLACS
jgi:hypothetical protein